MNMSHTGRLLAPLALGCLALSTAEAARWPRPPAQICIENNCVATAASAATPPAVAASSGAIKWHPGWYIENGSFVRGISSVSMAPTESDWAALPSFIKGINIHTAWAALEPTQNNFRTDWLQQQITWAKKYGKRVLIDFQPGAIGSNSFPTDALPAYLQNDPYGSFQATKYGPVARFWRPAVQDRIIAVLNNVCQKFNSEPNFEGIMLMETSWELVDSPDPQYSDSALLTSLKNINLGIRNACANTLITNRWNWVTPSAGAMLADFAEQHKLGIGSTDMHPLWITDMDYILKGAGSVGGKNWGTKDYRGRIPIMGASEFVPFMKDVCSAALVAYVNDEYKATHAFMSYQEPWTGALPCQLGPAMYAAIQAFGPLKNTACPSSFTSGCKTD
jgi:hypothetical protein